MQLRKTITSTPVLKVTSLILGFFLWKLLSDCCTISAWVQVPVCFYNGSYEGIQTPENITVELRGKRSHLRGLANLAVHINTPTLTPGPNPILVNQELMLLPPTISVGDTIPHNLVITKERS